MTYAKPRPYEDAAAIIDMPAGALAALIGHVLPGMDPDCADARSLDRDGWDRERPAWVVFSARSARMRDGSHRLSHWIATRGQWEMVPVRLIWRQPEDATPPLSEPPRP